MASGPITSWQIDGETMERVRDFIFLGSKITADGDSNHEIKRCLLLGRKAMTNLDSMLKSTHHFADKGLYSQIYVYFQKSCMDVRVGLSRRLSTKELIKIKLWCWTRLLRVPWTARRSNQSILKEITLEYSLEGLMLKLKLQYTGHLMGRTDSLENTLMLAKIEGRRRGNKG